MHAMYAIYIQCIVEQFYVNILSDSRSNVDYLRKVEDSRYQDQC